MKTLLALIAALTLFGCATVGREVSDAQIGKLKKGETTTDEAISALGTPTMSTRTSDGKQVLTYSFAHAQARPESFIPIVGAFIGGSDVRSSAVVLTFDKTGILQEYTSSQSFSGASMGLAGGYQAPDRTLPHESE